MRLFLNLLLIGIKFIKLFDLSSLTHLIILTLNPIFVNLINSFHFKD